MLTELRKQVVVVNVKAVVVFAPKNVQNVSFQKLSITLILPSGNIGIDVVAWAEKKLVLNGEARKHQLKQSYSTATKQVWVSQSSCPSFFIYRIQ